MSGPYWSAGGGKGWPNEEVLAVLKDRFDWPDRAGYAWHWGSPFFVNSGGRHPFIITADEQKATIALLAGEDVAWLPGLLGEPRTPPAGYFYCVPGVFDPLQIPV